MIKVYNFEKLEVWQSCRLLIKDIYLATSKFPDSETFGLKSQMRRSAISISSNIAEGSGKTHQKDQANFYQIAYASALELLSQLIVCSDLDYIKSEDYVTIRKKIEKITFQISGLRKSTFQTNTTDLNHK